MIESRIKNWADLRGIPLPTSWTKKRYKVPSVSKMSGKLGGILAINTSPLDNPFCNRMATESPPDTICRQCYSRTMLQEHRRNARPAWVLNGIILSETTLSGVTIPRFKPGSIVRFNGHGELLNRRHAENLIRIALRNPGSRFALWTKRYDLVQEALWAMGGKPLNLTLIYSNPRLVSDVSEIQAAPPLRFDGVFNVAKKEALVPVNCGKRKCLDCMACYGGEKGLFCIVERLK